MKRILCQQLQAEDVGEVLLQFLQGNELAFRHVGHRPVPEGKVKRVDIRALGRPVVFRSPEDNPAPNENLRGAVNVGIIMLEPVLRPGSPPPGCLPPGGSPPDGRPNHGLEHVDIGVTGKFLLRKFHLGKFHLENSSYGKFLLWKKTM